MQRLKLILTAAALAMGPATSACGAPTSTNASEARSVTATHITLKASDGVTIFGNLYESPNPRAMILLFHQADGSKDEYSSIGPRLAAMGYSALAIDQRTGGKQFGENETMTKAGLTDPDAFLAAMPDLQAALDWGSAKRLPVIIWGSSYSASLTFPLAVQNPGKVAAILAFSPGEYFPDPKLIRTAAAQVKLPVFITQAMTAQELADSKPVFEALSGSDKTLFEAKRGSFHGSLALSSNLNKAGAEENWQAVAAFLDGLKLN